MEDLVARLAVAVGPAQAQTGEAERRVAAIREREGIPLPLPTRAVLAACARSLRTGDADLFLPASEAAA